MTTKAMKKNVHTPDLERQKLLKWYGNTKLPDSHPVVRVVLDRLAQTKPR